MMRAIDADALLEDCKLVQKGAKDLGCEYASSFYSSSMELSTEWWCVEDLIENAPTIEPERKMGKWIEKGVNEDGTHNIVCSRCGEGFKTRGHANSRATESKWRFCPKCDADMRGDKNVD